MTARRHSGVRVLVTAVALLLATLMGAQTASVQAVSQALRPAATAAASSAVPPEHTSAEEDNKPRHGPRRVAGAQAPSRGFDRVCGCDVCTTAAHRSLGSVTLRDGTRRGRSVDLPLLHQTFRC